MAAIIKIDRSVIPACDVTVDRYEDIIRETAEMPQIGAYKISAELALSQGLPKLVEIAREYTDKPLIYDHQKACTDIPDTGKGFVKVVKDSGIDALILFPLTGPATQTTWIRAAKDINLAVIVGGHMTHERYLQSDGGYIDDRAVDKIFSTSADLGIANFVVPGNKPEVITHLRQLVIQYNVEPIFYAPGFIAQGGNISSAASVAGPKWHAIVGRAIYEAKDIQRTAESLVSQL